MAIGTKANPIVVSSKAKALTLGEIRFVQSFLLDFNAERAYVESGLAYGLSDKTKIQKCAKELLGRPYIKRFAQGMMDRALDAINRSAGDIIADTQRIARKAELEGQYGHALRAIELEGKYHKIFVDKVELESIDNRAEELMAAQLRVKDGRSED